MRETNRRRSGSRWLAACGGCAVIGLILLAIFVFLGYRAASSVTNALEGGAASEATARSILATDQLPPGWRSTTAFRSSLVGEFVILTDAPDDPSDSTADGGEVLTGEAAAEAVEIAITDAVKDGGRLFIYFRTRGISTLLAGSGDGKLEATGIEVDEGGELIASGTSRIRSGNLEWEVSRGTFTIQDRKRQGTITRADVRCDADDHPRLALLVEPESRSAQKTRGNEEPPADPDALSRLLDSFALCPP